MLLLPILVPLLMIAFGAFAELFDFSNSFIAFLGNANLALFVGLLGAYLIFRATAGLERTRETMDEGFHTTGEILLITGVGGSLGAVIGETNLDEVLGGLFSGRCRRTGGREPSCWPGSSQQCCTWRSDRCRSPPSPRPASSHRSSPPSAWPRSSSDLPSRRVHMFALQVNSNFFWMFKALLGLSTKGTLKTLTVATSVASVVSLPMVLVVSLFA